MLAASNSPPVTNSPNEDRLPAVTMPSLIVAWSPGCGGPAGGPSGGFALVSQLFASSKLPTPPLQMYPVIILLQQLGTWLAKYAAAQTPLSRKAPSQSRLTERLEPERLCAYCDRVPKGQYRYQGRSATVILPVTLGCVLKRGSIFGT